MAKKKGIFFTVSMALLGMSILAFAFLISYEEDEIEQGIIEILEMDNVYNKYAFTEYTVREIFRRYSGINLIKEENQIIIKENLPNNNKSNFLSQINGYEDFIRSDDVDINIIDNIIIKPYNFNYTQYDNIIKITIDEISNYSTLIYSEINITSLFWIESYDGMTPITIEAMDDYWQLKITKNIDFNAKNIAKLTTEAGDVIISVSRYNTSITNYGSEISVTNKIGIDTSELYFVFPNAVKIQFNGAKKEGDIRIE